MERYSKDNYKNRMFAAVTKNFSLKQAWSDSSMKFGFGDVKAIEFKDKIGNSKECMLNLNELFNNNDYGKKYLVIAEPSAGKTWAIAKMIKENSIEKIGKEFECDFISKKVINIFAVPTRSQAIQVSKEYDLEKIVGGDDVNISKSGFVCVYDKIIEFYDILSKIENLKDDYKINVIIDEAHLLIQDSNFRTKCINDSIKTSNFVLRNKIGNVIFITASFESLRMFKFDKTKCFYSIENLDKKPVTKIIGKPEGIDGNSFITNEIAKIIENGKIAYIRLQNKNLADDIANAVMKKNNKIYSYEKLNSDEKEINEQGNYTNECVDSLINNSYLPYRDMYFCTSMVDAGTNIKFIENIGDKEIVPIYILDSKNCVLDNIEQSFNRIRFSYKERFVLVTSTVGEVFEEDGVTFKVEKQELEDIIKEEYAKLKEDIDMYNTLYKHLVVNYGQEEGKRLFDGQINFLQKDGKSSVSNIEVNDKNIVSYNKIKFFKHCRENIFMKQFLNLDLLKIELEDILGGVVEFKTPEISEKLDIKVNKEDKRIEIFSNLKEDKKLMEEFDNKKGQEYKKLKEEEIINLYEIIRRKTDLKNTFEMFSSFKEKDIVKIAKDINKAEINELEENDKKAIVSLKENKVPQNQFNTTKVGNFMTSNLYLEDIDRLNFFLNFEESLNVIIKNKDDKDIKESILYLQSKYVNNQYILGLPACGSFEKEQYNVIKVVEEIKNDKLDIYVKEKTTKENDYLQQIVDLLNIRCVKKYTRKGTLDIILRTFKCTQSCEGYRVRGLNK